MNDVILYILAAPSAAPTSVSVSEVTSSSITVQWEAVDCIHQNGDIIGYSVRVVSIVGGDRIVNVGDDVSRVTIITGLIPSAEYTISVAAVNNGGTGVYSNGTVTQTEGEQ